MKRVYSKVDPSKLLYAICKSSDAKEYRTDIGPEEEFLQLSIRKLKKGITVPAHRHLPISKTADITQELWVVISGAINGTFYDINNEELETVELVDGDCALLFRGGHKLEVVKEDTIFYEIKTGPYYGKAADKEPIE